MSKATAILSIFFLNSLLTLFYISLVLQTFDVQELWNTYGYGKDNAPFLYDIMQYGLGTSHLTIEDAIIRLTVGSTAIHSVLLSYLFESETLYSSIIGNSFFISLTLMLISNGVKSIFLSYFLLIPFFVYYSIGWTKEIIFILSLAFFIRYSIRHIKINLFFSICLGLLSRPQFLPLQIAALFLNKISNRRSIYLLLISLALSPFWLKLVPLSYTSAAEEFYLNVGGQGFSVYTDYLKTDVPLLSIIGYLVAFAKTYYEPLSSLIASNGGLYSWIELYIQLLFLIVLKISRFEVLKIKMLFNLFLLTNIFIMSLPFTHFRYLLPTMVIYIIYSICHIVGPTRQPIGVW